MSDKQTHYPQHTLEQAYTIDYPILAYKSPVPNNREIVIAHVAQKMPQRSIHLKDWEFIAFVDGDFSNADTRK